MTKRLDVIGHQYGRLTVVGDAECPKHVTSKPRFVYCKCSCGNFAAISLRQLRSGKTKSCGCLAEEWRALESSRRSTVGMRFGRLLVVSRSIKRNGHRYDTCICDCGRTAAVCRANLKKGHTKSCGCMTISGASHHNWKGGVSRPYDTPEYRRWRDAVYERDGYKCDYCGRSGCELNAHHLYGYSTHPELIYDVSNGITLCKQHHYDFHCLNGTLRDACTPEDYFAFKALRALTHER